MATDREYLQGFRLGAFGKFFPYSRRSYSPPCKRESDFGVLIDSMLSAINAEASSQPGCKHKKLDAAARDIIIGYPWLGCRLSAQLPAFEQHLASDEKLALKTSLFRRI